MAEAGAPAGRGIRRRRIVVTGLLSLAAAATVGVWLAIVAGRAAVQRRAVEGIRALQGTAIHDYLLDWYRERERTGGPDFKAIGNILDRIPPPDLDPDGRGWLRRLLGPDLLHDAVRVNLAYFYDGSGGHHDNGASLDAVLPYLEALPRLRELYLHDQQATDEALRLAGGLKELRILMFWDARVTDAGVEHLRGLPKLRYLFLGEGKITDRSLEVVGTLRSLEGFTVQGNRFTDAGLVRLAALDGLKKLWLCGDDKDALSGKISDAGLLRLEGLQNLEELGLQHTGVTDAGLEVLRGLPSLKRVYLNGSRVTAAGAAAFRAARPEVKVEWSWGR